MTALTAILRVVDRKSVKEGTTVQELAVFVFENPDGTYHNTSVYKLEKDPNLMLQITAEHHAKAPRHPKDRGLIDLSGLFSEECRHDPDVNCPFTLWNQAHHEILFDNRIEAVIPTTQALYPQLGSRLTAIREKATKEYARQKWADGDPEWIKICIQKPATALWVEQNSSSALPPT